MTSHALTPEDDPENAADQERMRAHFATTPRLINHPGHAGRPDYLHVCCAEECVDVLKANPDFNCFHDGCAFECCACGRCSNPKHCSASGKGYSWHQ